MRTLLQYSGTCNYLAVVVGVDCISFGYPVLKNHAGSVHKKYEHMFSSRPRHARLLRLWFGYCFPYGRLSFSLWVVMPQPRFITILFRNVSPSFRYLFTNSWDADRRRSLSSSVKRRGTHRELTFDIFNSSAITLCTVFKDASTFSESSRTVRRRSSSSNAVTFS